MITPIEWTIPVWHFSPKTYGSGGNSNWRTMAGRNKPVQPPRPTKLPLHRMEKQLYTQNHGPPRFTCFNRTNSSTMMHSQTLNRRHRVLQTGRKNSCRHLLTRPGILIHSKAIRNYISMAQDSTLSGCYHF